MLSSQQLVQQGRISKRMVRLVAHLVLADENRTGGTYSLSSHALAHGFDGASASRHVRVVCLHASNQLHHGSRAKTDLPLLIGLSNSSNRLLS